MNKYNPNISEAKIQKLWKENNYFKSLNKGKKTFTILMPPPNVTGKLHLGHAWDSFYPDLLIRYKHLNGYQSIWYPGLDHAGIATQAKVEEKLYKERGIKREDLGREKFLKQVLDWKEEYSANIEKQWDKLGIAIDYDKTKFTLDKDVNDLVLNSFIDLHKKGLIYKSEKLINWDTVLKTAISNIEINHELKNGHLYNISYHLKDSQNQKIVISTTRPETMFGDEAIVVNPDDSRYKEFIGKIAINPINDKEIIIISDDYVEKDFGTGAMKVTPAHDFNDYELALKHKLKFTNIYNKNGTLNNNCLKYEGIDRFEARKLVIKDLKLKGNLVSIEDYKVSVGVSERSGSIVEPRISMQWFLSSSILSKKALDNQSTNNKVDFFPNRFESTFISWLEKMEDWTISRQLWWGHRIPAWYKDGEMIVQIESPGKGWKQDEDVLDTWFSSALWPIVFEDEKVIAKSDNPDYLSDLLFTGYDIILFWVSRMIFQSLQLKGKQPFKKAIIHGLIRDKHGNKMSKSLGNGVDPMLVIEKWGADSLRSFLLGNSSPGQDIKYNEDKIKASWETNNKLFNINNLISVLTKGKKISNNMKYSNLDKMLINKLAILKKDIVNNVEKYNLSFLITKINNFIWNDLGNNYMELVKVSNDNDQLSSMVNIFKNILILFHPFLPFITEELYLKLGDIIDVENSILLERYPSFEQQKYDSDIDLLINLIKTSRQAEAQIKNKKMPIKLITPIRNSNTDFFNSFLKKISNATIYFDKTPKEALGLNTIPGVGLIYYEVENENSKPLEEIHKTAVKFLKFELDRANNLLNNDKFLEKASPNLIKDEKDKKVFYEESLKLL